MKWMAGQSNSATWHWSKDSWPRRVRKNLKSDKRIKIFIIFLKYVSCKFKSQKIFNSEVFTLEVFKFFEKFKKSYCKIWTFLARGMFFRQTFRGFPGRKICDVIYRWNWEKMNFPIPGSVFVQVVVCSCYTQFCPRYPDCNQIQVSVFSLDFWHVLDLNMVKRRWKCSLGRILTSFILKKSNFTKVA